MLGRTTLPRERTVVAFLAACGTTAAEIERWVALRRDIEARLGEREHGETWAAQPAARATEESPAAEETPATEETPAAADPPAAVDPSAILEPPRAGDPPAPRRPTPRAPRSARRRLRLAVFALLGALTVGASGVLVSQQGGPDGPTEGCPLVLRQGMYGPCVLNLQERLVASGLPVAADGWFGPDTTSRVIAFQALGGMPVSGTADGQVLDELAGDPVATTVWPEDRIGKYVRELFPEDPARAVELARCLSGLDPYRVEVQADGSRRWGLFQFSDMELSRFGVDRRTALDPGWNIRAARGVWSRTGGFGHWHCESAR
ncbi:peptidoglycan-binding protein [Micromonospora sp. STR1_7]|uniref:Peptidoglycan-binding protein n=1 Tax=Micromonospora parastrephiae TaxID=2806101 RepID=A0ABS1XQN8_9ACTN|nr:peptidoglycan-binding domain-containing protein [Micromonospora parastrephiae]MBM0231559.1 peptidoglycan-binding protein [Micromonospora parastrephiae]